MSSLKVKLGILAAGLMLSGCMQATTYEATNQTNFKPRDKELLAKISLRQRRRLPSRSAAPSSTITARKRRARSWSIPTITISISCSDDGKAIRYGITVGEEAMAWSGIAKIGSMTEWPPWHPTKSEIERLGVPTFVAPGPDNPMGSRALYLYSGGKDTLFRIHGTNQPEYIGASISSGCIRMTNEDVIDLYNRVEDGHHRRGAGAASMATRRSIRRWRCRAAAATDDAVADGIASTRSKAPVLPALFCWPGFVGARLRSHRPGARRWRRLCASDLAASDLAASDFAATSRGGASSGRSAGNSGAICGSGSHTFHWQIL